MIIALVLAAIPVAVFFGIELADREAPPPPPFEKLPSDRIAADVAVLRAALLKGHAALYRYLRPAEVERLFAELNGAVSTPLTPVEFWRAITPRLARLRDGHVSLLPSGTMYAAFYNSPGARLPFTVHTWDDRFWIIDSFSVAAPRPGSEILAVEGVSMSELGPILRDYLPADGDVRSRKRAVVGRDFDLLLALHFGFRSTLRIDVMTAEGARRSHTVQTLSHKALLEARSRSDSEMSVDRGNRLTQTRDGATAILRVATFSRDAKPDFSEFLAASFRRLRELRIEHLIIDLRNNPGGRDSLGARLYAHLTDRPFRWVQRRRLNRNRFDFVRGTPVLLKSV